MTPQRLAVALVSLWVLCFLVAGLPLCGWGHYRFQPQTVPICNPVWVTEVGFALFLMLGGLTLPFIVMLSAYVRIVQIAKRHICMIEATAPVIMVGRLDDSFRRDDEVKASQSFAVSSHPDLLDPHGSSRKSGRRGTEPVVAGDKLRTLRDPGNSSQRGNKVGGVQVFAVGRLKDPQDPDSCSGPGGVKVETTRLTALGRVRDEDGSPRPSGKMGATERLATSNVKLHSSVQRFAESIYHKEKEQTGSTSGSHNKGLTLFRNSPKVIVTSQVETTLKTATANPCTYSSPTSQIGSQYALDVMPNVPSSPGTVGMSPVPQVASQEHTVSSLDVTSYLSPQTATLLKEKSVRRSPSIMGFASKRVFSKSVKMANRVFVAVGEWKLRWRVRELKVINENRQRHRETDSGRERGR